MVLGSLLLNVLESKRNIFQVHDCHLMESKHIQTMDFYCWLGRKNTGFTTKNQGMHQTRVKPMGVQTGSIRIIRQCGKPNNKPYTSTSGSFMASRVNPRCSQNIWSATPEGKYCSSLEPMKCRRNIKSRMN